MRVRTRFDAHLFPAVGSGSIAVRSSTPTFASGIEYRLVNIKEYDWEHDPLQRNTADYL